jgi:hypothetical protein
MPSAGHRRDAVERGRPPVAAGDCGGTGIAITRRGILVRGQGGRPGSPCTFEAPSRRGFAVRAVRSATAVHRSRIGASGLIHQMHPLHVEMRNENELSLSGGVAMTNCGRHGASRLRRRPPETRREQNPPRRGAHRRGGSLSGRIVPGGWIKQSMPGRATILDSCPSRPACRGAPTARSRGSRRDRGGLPASTKRC